MPTCLHTDKCCDEFGERPAFGGGCGCLEAPRLWPVDIVTEGDWVASLVREVLGGADLIGGDMSARLEMDATRFLDVDKAAELLSVSKRTIYGWVQQGRIPYRKAGRRVLFLESELLEWTKPNDRRQYLELIR